MADWKSLSKNPKEWPKLKYDDPRLDAFAKEVENRYKLPPGMLVALKNAGERTNPGRISPKGAKGIMQFTDNTLKLKGGKYKHNVDDPFESINAAGIYMRDLIKENTQRWKNVHGDKPVNMKTVYHAAFANYNGGPYNAKPVIRGEEPPVEEARNYVKRIVSYLDQHYRQPSKPKEQPIEEKKEPVKQEVATQQPTIPENLEQLSHFELMELRQQFKDKAEQDKIAPYEHRAWAREYVKENPEAALVMPGLIMAYNTAKGLGLREGRSDPSAKAILEGLKGTVEGLGGRAKEEFGKLVGE